jgi:hypothetical protein
MTQDATFKTRQEHRLDELLGRPIELLDNDETEEMFLLQTIVETARKYGTLN